MSRADISPAEAFIRPTIPGYRSTALRHPKEPLVIIPQTLSELTGPVYPYGRIATGRQRPHPAASGEPLGSASSSKGACSTRMAGPSRTRWSRSGRPTPPDATPTQRSPRAPLDPNFSGAGRTLTDDDGRFRFVTIRPGAYPWKNHPNAWRPAHIHFSLFGELLARLITQMYFPGDPLAALRPDLQFDPGRARAGAVDFAIHWTRPNRSGRSASGSISSCVDRAARPWRITRL